MEPSSVEIERLLTAATLAVSLLTVLLLVAQRREQPQSLPLALFLAINAVTDLDPLLPLWLSPGASLLANALAVPCFLLLAPLFWSYVRLLTVERPQPWRLPPRHLLPALIGLLLMLPLLSLDPERRLALGEGAAPGGVLEGVALLGLLVAMLAWVLQAGGYLAACLRRLLRVRLRLRDWFSSTHRRELGWLLVLVLALAFYWLLVVIDLLGQLLGDGPPLIGAAWLSLYGLVFLLGVSVWGLRQRQVFQGEAEPAALVSQTRYERSALTRNDASRIAAKLAAAMAEGLYADPNLSLRRLSDHLGVSTNYLSQVLNQSLGESFFDYVNRHRVEAALPLVAAGEQAVADIAVTVGFNSRSSFYKAFGKVTGTSPSAWRKRES